MSEPTASGSFAGSFERGRNLEGQHNSKCNVKNHHKVKSFRCSFSTEYSTSPLRAVAILPPSDFHEVSRAGGRKGHSQKTGGHLSTFRRLGVPKRKPLSFQSFTDSLTDREKRISFFSLVHSFPRDGRYAPRLPNLELISLPIPAPLCPLFSITYQLKI